MSASETPKSRLETRSFPPVSTPAPLPPPAAPLKPPKPLSNMSCCHLSGSCFGCNRWKRTHLLTSGSTCLCQSQSPQGWVLGKAGAPLPTWPGCSAPPRGSPTFPAHPTTTIKSIRPDGKTNRTQLCQHGDGVYLHYVYTRNVKLTEVYCHYDNVHAYIWVITWSKYSTSIEPTQKPCTKLWPIPANFQKGPVFLPSAPPPKALQKWSSGSQGRLLKQCCLQRCTMFPGPIRVLFKATKIALIGWISVHKRMGWVRKTRPAIPVYASVDYLSVHFETTPFWFGLCLKTHLKKIGVLPS